MCVYLAAYICDRHLCSSHLRPRAWSTRGVVRPPCQDAAGYFLFIWTEERINYTLMLQVLVSRTGCLPCPYEDAEQCSAKHGSNCAPQRHERRHPRTCSGKKRARKKHFALSSISHACLHRTAISINVPSSAPFSLRPFLLLRPFKGTILGGSVGSFGLGPC